MKTEITKELIDAIISSTHEEITIEDIYTSIRMRDYIYDHLEYFKTQKFSMVDVTAGFVVAVKQLIKEVEEYNNLSIVCDETNNTPETMNQNKLIIDVYEKIQVNYERTDT